MILQMSSSQAYDFILLSLAQWSISVPPENVRKQKVYWRLQEV